MKILILLISLKAFAAPAEIGILDWGDNFRKIHGNDLAGRDRDGAPCMLSSFDRTYDGETATCGHVAQREAYLSLGKSAAGFMTDHFIWIGTWINPDCSMTGPHVVNAVDVTPRRIHINVTQSEGVPEVVQNDLVIKMDEQGNVVEARGRSSRWPAITCRFDSAAPPPFYTSGDSALSSSYTQSPSTEAPSKSRSN